MGIVHRRWHHPCAADMLILDVIPGISDGHNWYGTKQPAGICTGPTVQDQKPSISRWAHGHRWFDILVLLPLVSIVEHQKDAPKGLCLWLHHTAGCERGRQWRKALALLFDMDLFSIEKDWVKISVHGRMFLLTFWWRTASHSTENTNFSAENSRILWYSWDHWNKHNG